MIPNHSVIVSATEPKGKNRKKVWFRKGRNSFNKNDIISGAYLSDKGVITKNDGQNYSNYISVVSNTMCTIHAENLLGVAPSVCFYDENKNFISGTAYNNVKSMSFKTPTTCKFVRVSVSNANLETLQLEAGTIATPYEAYVENKMFVKNSNDVYEEFIKKQEEIYSTNEKNIGKWIDGRALYRKVIIIKNTALSKGNNSIAHGISNIDKAIRITGFNYNGAVLPYINLNADSSLKTATFITGIDSTNITFRIINDDWGAQNNWCVIIEYIKTI